MRFAMVGLLTAMTALLGLAESARAVTIKNNGMTIFSDDFEKQTVGSPPTTANMSPVVVAGSSWSVAPAGGTRTSRNVISTPVGTTFPPDAPGPYQGSNYLLINIPRDASGYGTSVTANFAEISAGDTLSISFAYAWGTGGTTTNPDAGNNNGGPQLQLLDANGEKAIWMDSGDSSFHFYSGDAETELGTITNAKGAVGTWHTFSLIYKQGTNSLTVTVDGQSTVLASAVADASLLPNQLVMNTTRAGVIAFDAVPEPHAIVLAVVGIVGVGMFRMRRKGK